MEAFPPFPTWEGVLAMDTSDPAIAKGSDFCDGLANCVAKSITDSDCIAVPDFTEFSLHNPRLVLNAARPLENFGHIISRTFVWITASSIAEIVVSPMVDCEVSPNCIAACSTNDFSGFATFTSSQMVQNRIPLQIYP